MHVHASVVTSVKLNCRFVINNKKPADIQFYSKKKYGSLLLTMLDMNLKIIILLHILTLNSGKLQ